MRSIVLVWRVLGLKHTLARARIAMVAAERARARSRRGFAEARALAYQSLADDSAA